MADEVPRGGRQREPAHILSGPGIGPWGNAFRPERASCDNFHKLSSDRISPHSARLMATETTLRPGELKEVLLKEIQSARSGVG